MLVVSVNYWCFFGMVVVFYCKGSGVVWLYLLVSWLEVCGKGVGLVLFVVVEWVVC